MTCIDVIDADLARESEKREGRKEGRDERSEL